MKTWTVDTMMDCKPCYSRNKVKVLFGNAKELTTLEILNRDDIPQADRIWVGCREDASIVNRWLEIVITRAITEHVLTCGVSVVEKWGKNWIAGVDRTTTAAYSAADSAYSAYSAADSAYSAAYSAADAADAAADSAYSADAAAEQDQQIVDFKSILEGDK